jgi:hypothetical protein
MENTMDERTRLRLAELLMKPEDDPFEQAMRTAMPAMAALTQQRSPGIYGDWPGSQRLSSLQRDGLLQQTLGMGGDRPDDRRREYDPTPALYVRPHLQGLPSGSSSSAPTDSAPITEIGLKGLQNAIPRPGFTPVLPDIFNEWRRHTQKGLEGLLDYYYRARKGSGGGGGRDPDCDEEWRHAREWCASQLAKPDPDGFHVQGGIRISKTARVAWFRNDAGETLLIGGIDGGDDDGRCPSITGRPPGSAGVAVEV